MFIFPAPTLPGKGKATRATSGPRVSANMCHLVWLNQCLRPTCWGYSKIQRFCFAPSSAMEIAWPSCLTMSPLTKGLFWWPSGEVLGIWCEVGFPNFFGLTKADSEKQPWQIEAMISNRIVWTLGHSPPKKKRKFPIEAIDHHFLTRILVDFQARPEPWQIDTPAIFLNSVHRHQAESSTVSCSYVSWYSLILCIAFFLLFQNHPIISPYLLEFLLACPVSILLQAKIYFDCWGAMAGRCATWTGAVRSRGMQMCSCWTPICQLLK